MEEQARIEGLKREECVIRAWIRDVTGEKQARLCAIRAELRALCGSKAAEPTKAGSGVAR